MLRLLIAHFLNSTDDKHNMPVPNRHNSKGIAMIQKVRVQSFVLGLGVSAIFASQAMAADVYQGTAKFRSADGKQMAIPVTITVDKSLTDAERTAILEAVKAKPDGAKAVLAGKPQLGVIEANNTKVAIRYVYASSLVEGQNLTVI